MARLWGGGRPGPEHRVRRASESHTRGDALRDRLAVVGELLAPDAIRRRWIEIERRLGITRAGQIALLGAVGLWIAARIIAGVAMYLVAYGALLLLVLAYLLTPRRLRLEGERTGLYPRSQEGDRLDVELRLRAKRRMTTFILEEQVPERLGRSVRVPVTKLAGGEEVSHFYSIRCQRRGSYQIGPLVAVATDPLGLAERQIVVCEPFELLVHPRVETVTDRPLTRQYEDPPMRPPVSKPWPSGLEFYGMREYKPGDDLRRVVWRATARTGVMMVREAEQGITDRITIVLDTDRVSHSHDGEGFSESFEAAVRAAASLGVHHLRVGFEVRVETNGGPLVRPLRTQTSQLQLLDALARVEMVREPLTAVLGRLLASPARDSHVVLITPRLGALEAAQLKLLLDTGVSVLVIALLWDDESADTVGIAGSLGCAVVGVHPGQDLASALVSEMGAGLRL
ncbi:MAG: DUF58 domain-containing protein [Acidimicrobiales bacterium]